MFVIMYIGTFDVSVLPPIFDERRNDKMKKRIFVIKVLHNISLILLLLTLLVTVIKK